LSALGTDLYTNVRHDRRAARGGAIDAVTHRIGPGRQYSGHAAIRTITSRKPGGTTILSIRPAARIDL